MTRWSKSVRLGHTVAKHLGFQRRPPRVQVLTVVQLGPLQPPVSRSCTTCTICLPRITPRSTYRPTGNGRMARFSKSYTWGIDVFHYLHREDIHSNTFNSIGGLAQKRAILPQCSIRWVASTIIRGKPLPHPATARARVGHPTGCRWAMGCGSHGTGTKRAALPRPRGMVRAGRAGGEGSWLSAGTGGRRP